MKKNINLSWDDLNIDSNLLSSIKNNLKYEKPTLIQQKLIKDFRNDMDIIAASETGSGKTVAFGVPILSKILKNANCDVKMKIKTKECEETDLNMCLLNEAFNDNQETIKEFDKIEGCVKVIDNANFFDDESDSMDNIKVSCLILSPTRDLAMQIKNNLKSLAHNTELQIISVVGGMSIQKQERLFKTIPDVIVATPGRLWDIVSKNKRFRSMIEKIDTLVIDEADRMAEAGHFIELKEIFKVINQNTHQSILVSATLTLNLNKKKNKNFKTLIKCANLSKNRKIVDLTNQKIKIVSTVSEFYSKTTNEDKDVYLVYFLRTLPGKTIVFSNSKNCTYRLISLLKILKFNVFCLHSAMLQKRRFASIDKFKENAKSILISTDVASRGIDICDVANIIHYEIPKTTESYIHRCGRSGRVGKKGKSIICCSPQQFALFKKLLKDIEKEKMLSIEVNSDIYIQLKPIVKLANNMELDCYRNKKTKSDVTWTETIVKNADILETNENDSDTERNKCKIDKLSKWNKSKLNKMILNFDNFMKRM